MAKQLIVVRHGKSDQGTYGMSDFERTLNHRGNKNAHEMAERITQKDIIPELIVSSPAVRALTTARHFADVLKISYDDIQLEASVYEANTTALLKVINQLNNDFERIALFGHNPGLTELVNYLADAKIYNLPTAGVVVIDFPFDDWQMVSQHTGSLFFFDSPKGQED
ncbi:phosphohistidine phosphatase [Pedobacter westerhofensis]|uniref:Phosphohistidine phosphatase n=1 Tax=Pedobacter westerhofensis TaxID=425512 RepID=A0A521E7K9_9SPHI|nr:histidine phosphatase family protein [Pedobacter westerhofensis]SMO79933.1 phosphohistidine phosphatase [Pedobacter westerhofensis]